MLFAQELKCYGTDTDGGRRFEHRLNWLLLDVDFLKVYHSKLELFSSKEYLDSIINISKPIFQQKKNIEKQLNFTWDRLWINQKTILSALDPTDALQVNVVKNNYKTILNIFNANYIGIEIIDIINKNEQTIGTPKETPYVFGRDKKQHSIHQLIQFDMINKMETESFLQYKIIGLDKVYHQKIDFWNNALSVDELFD